VLLLDEPFGALDTKVRKELRRWLRRLHDEMHISSVFVTHDQEEALEVADRVVVMNHGKIEQIGSPDEVYSSSLLNVSYDPTRELYKDFNAAFRQALAGEDRPGRSIQASRTAARASRRWRCATGWRPTSSRWRWPTTSTRWSSAS
jgi:ABC-type sulfate/molybdate transport systems ATPase subunit